ncbi:interleukin-17F-like [Cololabis saira]|uniref:interleukin-17F-like n=1 Tax=Cololabis saira TaxID=129043 RepID=UPI002AD1D80D|nr:interleukin-17F-like [Cololabis saira]
MFSPTNSFKLTFACVVLMMMMTDSTVMSKGPKMVQLLLDPSALVPSRTNRPLENASISPWAYNDSVDPSLLTQLSEARCLLRGCLNSSGREDRRLESRPIMHQVLLLRRVKPEGAGPRPAHNYHYRLESRLVSVGCTCVRPTVQVQE